MKRCTPLALLLLTGVVVAAAQDDAAKMELKKFEGTWVMVSGEAKGENLPDTVVQGASLIIEGDKHTVKVGTDTIIGTHKPDPTKNPKALDTMDTEGPFKGKNALGIYKFEKGQLSVCFAPPGNERPKEFTTRSGTAVLLHVWKKKN